MSTSLGTQPLGQASSGQKSGMVVVFYFVTFLTGGFFLFAGGRSGLVVELTTAVFYVAVTLLFYALNKEPKDRL